MLLRFVSMVSHSSVRKDFFGGTNIPDVFIKISK